jgi:hypothetical protein
MEETVDIGFEEFFGAYDGEGNHTETVETAEPVETPTDEKEPTESETVEASESGEKTEEESAPESEEKPTEETPEPEKQESKHSFDNIKVNGEIRSVSYDDAPAWIQKGMDYDRIKGKLEEERQANTEMKQTMEKWQATIEVLEMISGDTGVKLDDMLHSIHKSYRMQNGESEKEAEANIRAAKAERESNAIKAQREKQQTEQKSQQDRANREFAEFRAAHPDVQLDDKLVAALKPDVTAGMSLLSAYQKMLNRQQAEQIAELQRQLAAEKQNKKNAVTSPGSQKDSGGQRQKDQYDDFFSAFDK